MLNDVFLKSVPYKECTKKLCWPVSSAASVSSAAPKKKSFDRGGPVWPPRSNAKYDRLGGGLRGLETIENGAETIENGTETIENHAEKTENDAETIENGAETIEILV